MRNSTLLDNVRESFGRVVYTHKTHEKMADRLAVRTTWLKWIELLLIVLTTGSTINVFLGAGRAYEITSAVLASLTLLTSIYQFRFDPEKVIQAHRNCAKKLWLIREKYITLISDICDGAIDQKLARSRRDDLLLRLHSIYETAPDTDDLAYAQARNALKINEEMTFTDSEIDAFLPDSLRKTQYHSNGSQNATRSKTR